MRLRTGIIALVLVTGILCVAYASRGTWRSWLETVQRPAIPVAIPYQPVPSSRPTQKPTTSTLLTVTSTQLTSSTRSTPVATTTPVVLHPFEFFNERPAEVNLAVPFMLQAPKQNWDMPYQEACEEASLLMVTQFLRGRSADIGAEEADRLILDLVAYETSQGDPPDVALSRVAQIAQARYGLRTQLRSIASIEPIKNALANGYPVIIPASGKALKNPNFRNGGPPYHMLVVRGYLRDGQIITNDPGTRKGKEYLYDESVLFEAIHDWNDGDVPRGEKLALVLLPNK